MKRTILLLLFAMISSSLAATFTGKITNIETSEPIIGANVVVLDTQKGAATNNDGKFTITDLNVGNYDFQVSHVSYELYKGKINIGIDNFKLDIQLVPTVLEGEKVEISASRAEDRLTPVTFSNVNQKEIDEAYWAQDIPMLLAETPNVHAYSDAGNGLGYSYLKIRGFDQTRVGVMINGIPLNDPEDNQVYWVDMPDFPESIQDIQIQRGASNSLFGVSSFGGTVNIITDHSANTQGIKATIGTGSYNTKKWSLQANSGLINNSYSISARFSRVLSDGYRDNASFDSWAYFINATKFTKNSTTKINVYGGPELTYASWDAVQEDIYKENRTYNPSQDPYSKTVDNFNQPHYELINEWKISDNLTLSNTLFYINGKGYYELYKTAKSMYDFGLSPVRTSDAGLFGTDSLSYYANDGINLVSENGDYIIESTDLVNQKWVDKHELGWLPRLTMKHKKGTLTLGGHVDKFNSEHYGHVLWARVWAQPINPDQKYYNYFGDKTTLAFYINELYKINDELNVMADVQFQHKTYEFHHKKTANFSGENVHKFKVSNTFINPRLGVNYNMTKHVNIFSSIAMSQREPIINDYWDAWIGPDDLGERPLFKTAKNVYKNGQIDHVEFTDPLIDPERLIDIELGTGYISEKLNLKANVYWMDFSNEVIAYGQVNEDGSPIRGNADKTVHRGIELTMNSILPANFTFSGNLAVSQNFYDKFMEKGWAEDWSTMDIDRSGNTIPLFPGVLANAKLAYQLKGLNLAAHLQHVGKQYLDNTQDDAHSLDAYTILNLKASVNLQSLIGLKGLNLSLHLNNVLNTEYIPSGYYDSWAGYNYYYPAATRNFYISLTSTL